MHALSYDMSDVTLEDEDDRSPCCLPDPDARMTTMKRLLAMLALDSKSEDQGVGEDS